ncbi:SigE family RNA polymerase sigma factor [Actinoplanes sp. TBRC 11911]|uniref:SigE family RNA polymerase sigma factor n=1 Tax=Actinoplanes sp. TBRC 11911 TaxID=2729386 RepID=UPI0028A0B937|nr:SigE family RNA polymerase sigma factor [Actinoplanes sp. TBRC 11911]
MDTAEDEFDTFVRARTHALLRSAYLLTGDQQLAEDLVQSALTRTHQSWKRLAHSGNAEAYARRTMYHLQVSWWRRRRVAEVLPERMPDRPGREDHAGEVSLRLALREALARLTARQRAVLVLRFFEDCTEREVADMLGVSIGTVKSQTAKALARLRTIAPELADVDGRKEALS